MVKLDFGSGPNPKEGFEGVDCINFGQKHVFDLTQVWPWEDGSVEEARASHFLEHLEPFGRIHFVNELWRVLKPEGKCEIVVPHWASCRAYGDLTHRWPPVSEFWFFYLNYDWRKSNAPHNLEYKCNFDASWGYGMKPELMPRNLEYQMYALQNFKEAATDLVATLTKRPLPQVVDKEELPVV